MLPFPVFTYKTQSVTHHLADTQLSFVNTSVIMHTDTQVSQSGFLSWKHTSYANTPTCTHFHTHRDTFQTQNLLKNTISSPCVPRWSWQWERNTVHENCWTLWISLCIRGRAVEEEDDTQCHQQQKVESHCQNHYKWRAGTSGRSVFVCVCVCFAETSGVSLL